MTCSRAINRHPFQLDGRKVWTRRSPCICLVLLAFLLLCLVQSACVDLTNSGTSHGATDPAPAAPSITTHPASQAVTAGQTATFSVGATGTAPLSYQWQENGTALNGATSASYTSKATTTSDNAAHFTVIVSNSAGSVTSSAATLTVSSAPVAPSITAQPVSQAVTAGQTATFSVGATGTAPLSYQWQENGTALNGATSASYTNKATTTSDNAAHFTVVVSNSAGSVTSSAATLTVSSAPVAPSITAQPVSQAVTAGQTATFSVGATGTAPLSYQWQENGTALNGATSASYTSKATTTSDNAAHFTVVVSNSAGSVTSSAATLTVSSAPVAPSITAQPVSQAVTAGQTATFSVGATGTAPLSYQWQENGTALNGATSANYTSTATTTSDNAAHFTVIVSNSAGSVTSSAATLTVNAASVQLTASVEPSLVRVGPTDPPGTTSSVRIAGARGETVDTQVIVSATSSGLTNVNISASALIGPNGASIPASNVTLYREYYITVMGTTSYGGGSNPPLGSGTYPEPLIPFDDPETGSALCGNGATLQACNASVSAGQNQPYWIDIFISRGSGNSPPGTYSGAITVTSDQGSTTIPVTLIVWNFELPIQPSELSLWTGFSPAAGNTLTTLDQALMRNKVMGWYDVATNASSDVTNFGLDRSGLDNYYLYRNPVQW